MTTNQLTDTELFVQIRAGSKEAFEELYGRYYLYLVRFAATVCKDSLLAEDIAAEAFLIVWKKRATIVNPAKIKTYLSQVVKRAAIKSVQKGRRTQLGLIDKNIRDEAADPESRYVDAETYRLLLEQISDLADDERHIIEGLMHGYTVIELVNKLGKSQPNISQMKKRAIDRLKNALKKQCRAVSEYLIQHCWLIRRNLYLNKGANQ